MRGRGYVLAGVFIGACVGGGTGGLPQVGAGGGSGDADGDRSASDDRAGRVSTQGAEGGPCYEGGTCDESLSCASDLCVDLGGVAGDGASDTDDCVVSLEICNGADDDCDGIVDEPTAADAQCEKVIVNAVTFCDRRVGVCVPVECLDGFLQCDGFAGNGCEPECECNGQGCARPLDRCWDAADIPPGATHPTCADVPESPTTDAGQPTCCGCLSDEFEGGEGDWNNGHCCADCTAVCGDFQGSCSPSNRPKP